MKVFRTICRILVGIVFVFSGFVKGVDPMGTVFRMEDYFVAFGIPWAGHVAIPLTIILVTLEFIIGISLLFNLWLKRISLILLPMMIFFTVLTFFDAAFNIVPDCGCFGDAIKLSNLNTFLKNLALMVFVIPIFMQRKKFKTLIPVWSQVILITIVAVLFAGTSLYSYRHLPLKDFMSWKVGNQVNQVNTTTVKFYVTYQNKKNPKKELTFEAPNYPWNDSVWMSQWVFKSQHPVESSHGPVNAVRIEDEAGIEVTSLLLNNPGLQFLFVTYDLSSANTDAFLRILPFNKKAIDNGCAFVCLTNSTLPEIKKFKIDHGTAFHFYQADDVVLKTMVRSNPGLILLKGGKVLAKWHYNDIPSFEEIFRKYKNQ